MEKINYFKSLIKSAAIYFRDKTIRRKKASVLMYHSIGENSEFFTVTAENFRWQMAYLKENNYNVISLAALISLLKEKKKIPAKTVVLTFDDGYEDNYTLAFPVLKELNFPATIFLATSWVGDKEHINRRSVKLPMLDWAQIRRMHESGLIDFQPHTVSHPKLNKISLAEAEREIIQSKEAVEKELNKKCDFFSYPYGLYNKEIKHFAGRFFSAIFTVWEGFVGAGDDLSELARNPMDSFTDEKKFKLEI